MLCLATLWFRSWRRKQVFRICLLWGFIGKSRGTIRCDESVQRIFGSRILAFHPILLNMLALLLFIGFIFLQSRHEAAPTRTSSIMIVILGRSGFLGFLSRGSYWIRGFSQFCFPVIIAFLVALLFWRHLGYDQA